MNPLTRTHRPRRLLLGLVLASSAGMVAGPLDPAQAAGPGATAAQAGCVANYLSLRSIHVNTNEQPEAGPGASRNSARASAIARIMIFKVRITCTPNTSWKTTLQIRKRRKGPDKNVAYKQFKGSGSKTFTVGADCKRGQSFNGNFRINFVGSNISADRVVKNKKCT